MSGKYDKDEINVSLNRDIYASVKKDIRINQTYNDKEIYFQKIMEEAINKNLLGNSLRWIAKKT